MDQNRLKIMPKKVLMEKGGNLNQRKLYNISKQFDFNKVFNGFIVPYELKMNLFLSKRIKQNQKSIIHMFYIKVPMG